MFMTLTSMVYDQCKYTVGVIVIAAIVVEIISSMLNIYLRYFRYYNRQTKPICSKNYRINFVLVNSVILIEILTVRN